MTAAGVRSSSPFSVFQNIPKRSLFVFSSPGTRDRASSAEVRGGAAAPHKADDD